MTLSPSSQTQRPDGRRRRDRLPTTALVLATVATLAAASCGDPGPSGSGGDGAGPSGPGGVSVIPTDTVALDTLLARLLATAPGRESRGYAPPDSAERSAFLEAVERAAGGDVDDADEALSEFRYDAGVAVEAGTGDSLLLIAERTPAVRGWGTYVRRLSPRVAGDVHVNHPRFDLDTPLVALPLYRECRCRWLLVAGTHRYANPDDASDMARSETSVFQGLWERVAADAAVAVSVHGFAAGNHDDPVGSSDVVLSNGGTSLGEGLAATDAARELRDSLRAEGWTVGLAGQDEGYEALAGTVNPQGQHANRIFGHGRWLQLELARPLRAAEESRRVVARVVGSWILRRGAVAGTSGAQPSSAKGSSPNRAGFSVTKR